MRAFTEPDANVVVAVIGFAGAVIVGLIGLYAQGKRNTKAQRADHATTADKVDRLVIAVGELAESGREIHDDVREIKAEVRDHGQRLRSLESLTIAQNDVEAIVSRFTQRKAQ